MPFSRVLRCTFGICSAFCHHEINQSCNFLLNINWNNDINYTVFVVSWFVLIGRLPLIRKIWTFSRNFFGCDVLRERLFGPKLFPSSFMVADLPLSSFEQQHKPMSFGCNSFPFIFLNVSLKSWCFVLSAFNNFWVTGIPIVFKRVCQFSGQLCTGFWFSFALLVC